VTQQTVFGERGNLSAKVSKMHIVKGGIVARDIFYRESAM